MASLMNGLSAAGGGLAAYAANAGAEAQKSDAAMALQASGGVIQGDLQTQRAALEQQQARLADSLATTRSLTLQRSAGDIAAEAQARTQTFQSSEAEKARNADPEAIKILRILGGLPPAAGTAAAAPSGGASPAPSSGGATDDTSSFDSSAPSSPASSPAATGGRPASAGIDADMRTRLIEKTMGLPMAGSDASIRASIAKDVSSDPDFKYKPIGQQAAEIENRLAVAKGTMTDSATQDVLAKAIAGYQKAPLDQRAITMGGGAAIMKKVLEINPDYQEARYPEVAKVMAAFGSGAEGDKVRFQNTAISHLSVLDQAAEALKNNDVRGLNTLTNYFKDQFGQSAPNTFEGLKQIVGTEIEKAIAGGIGAASDRDRIMKSLSVANSPQQLQDITNSYRDLMAGQLKGLKRQYEDGTGFKSGPFAFENKLDPETLAALGSRGEGKPKATGAPSPVPSSNTTPAVRPPLSDILRIPTPATTPPPSAPY